MTSKPLPHIAEPDESAEPQEIARQAMQKMITQFGWQPTWVIADECRAIVKRAEAQRGTPKKAIERLVLNRYCELWYAACCSGKPYQQHQAFHALHQYLYRIALYQAQNRYLCSHGYAETLAEDVAQAAAANIWPNLGTVKEPGSFLGYAKQTMQHELSQMMEREGKALSLDQAEEAEMNDDDNAASGTAGPEEERDSVSAAEEAIRRCLRNKEKQQIIIDNLLNNKTLQQIADALGKKSTSVRMRKKRALVELGACAEMQKLLSNRGKTPPANTAPGEAATLHYLFQAIMDQPDTALSCAIAESWLPSFVAAEVAGEDAVAQYPDVKRHLDLCPACEHLYTETIELALAEAADTIPQPPQLPIPDLSFLPPLPSPVAQARALVKQVAAQVLGVLAPTALPTLPALEEKFVQRVEALGGRLPTYRAPATTLSQERDPTTAALVTLSATLLTTQQIAIRYNAQELPAQLADAAFYQSIQAEASRIAQANGMTADDAQAFAHIYAAAIRANPAAWLTFVTAVQA
ncbi:MAG: sigma-70 family RNA polymerase sigma factor [Caldilineaceae bacterium]|nr:sigma-70 family RNA polymerase sigma factor [Caldilineaceae bacterium]